MKKSKYTITEIKLLNSNPNVKRVKYGRQIEYNPSFKKWAVIQSMKYPELSANQIFEMAGFDTDILGARTAESRIRYWKGTLTKYKEFYYEPKEKLSNQELDKQNNAILLLLLSRFEELIEVLGARNGKR